MFLVIEENSLEKKRIEEILERHLLPFRTVESLKEANRIVSKEIVVWERIFLNSYLYEYTESEEKNEFIDECEKKGLFSVLVNMDKPLSIKEIESLLGVGETQEVLQSLENGIWLSNGNKPSEMVAETGNISESSGDSKSEQLPDIEGMDWEYARRFLPEDGIIYEMVKGFHESMGTEMEKIEFDLYHIDETDAYADYKLRVHSLKSLCASMGAVGLAEMAKVLDRMAKQNRVDEIRCMTPVFLEMMGEYKERFDEVFENEELSEEDKLAFVKEEFLQQLESLLQEMLNMQVDEADERMEQLMLVAVPEFLKASVKQLRQAERNLDTNGAMEIIEDMKNRMCEGGGPE